MYTKTLMIVIFNLATFKLIEGISFQLNIPRCSYKCVNSKKDDNTKKIKGYYWRDFYGIVPPDAFPLGGSNQNPQTYVGMVYDPSHNGTFVTTIVQGQNYVYSVLNNKATKISDIIQILCTMEPEKMTWMELYNVEQLEGYSVVKGSNHYEARNETNFAKYIQHFVAKTSDKNVIYAGYATGLNTSMAYALIDGTPRMTETFQWLLLSKESKKEHRNSGAKPLFSYNYNLNLNTGSFVPQFHNQINIGSCSLICTNRGGKGSTETDKKMKKLSENAMVYYWTPRDRENNEDEENALIVGKGFYDNPQYVGQAYTTANCYDVGQAEGSSVYITKDRYAEVPFEFQYLSSINQERFEWINTTTTTFQQLDTTTLVRGGKMDNGTRTFVGRAIDSGNYKAGSIRVVPNGAYCYLLYGVKQEFQALSIKDKTT